MRGVGIGFMLRVIVPRRISRVVYVRRISIESLRALSELGFLVVIV